MVKSLILRNYISRVNLLFMLVNVREGSCPLTFSNRACQASCFGSGTVGARRFQAAQARPPFGGIWSSASGSVITVFGGKVWPGSGVLSAVAARAPHVGVQVRTDRSGVRGRRPACVGAISSSPCVPAGRIRVARRRAPVVDCVLMRSPRRGRGCRCATWRAGSPPACAPGRPWLFAARCARRSRGPSRAGGMRRACAS